VPGPVRGRTRLRAAGRAPTVLRERSAHLRLSALHRAGAHRGRGNEHARQVAEVQRTGSAARGRSFVAHPSSSAASNTSCASATAVPIAIASRENRLSSIPRQPLRHAVAHRRHARATCRRHPAFRASSRSPTNGLEGLMRGEDRCRPLTSDVGRGAGHHPRLSSPGSAANAVRHVGAPHAVGPPRASRTRSDRSRYAARSRRLRAWIRRVTGRRRVSMAGLLPGGVDPGGGPVAPASAVRSVTQPPPIPCRG